MTATVKIERPRRELTGGRRAARDAMNDASLKLRRDRIELVKGWLAAHYLSNPSNADAARACGLSPFHFNREFRIHAGTTYHRYVTALRIDEAKRRMLAGADLAFVATSVGFCHQSAFTSRFKQVTGQTPTAWRRAALAGNAVAA